MRSKINTQFEFNFQPSTLQITNEYYAKHEAISVLLDEHPETTAKCLIPSHSAKSRCVLLRSTVCLVTPPSHPGNRN